MGLHREACLGKTERGKEWPSPSQGTNGLAEGTKHRGPGAPQVSLSEAIWSCWGDTESLLVPSHPDFPQSARESLWPHPPGPPGPACPSHSQGLNRCLSFPSEPHLPPTFSGLRASSLAFLWSHPQPLPVSSLQLEPQSFWQETPTQARSRPF